MQNVLVLIVEDDALIRLEIETSLQEGGFATESASNGESAIVKLEARADIRAIVTDINLGAGMTGWGVARRARELMPDLPVVYVTSVSAADWTAQGVPHSIMVSKPFVPAQIITAISQLLNVGNASTP